MPQPGQYPDNQNIAYLPPFSLPVPAKRDINIIPKPRAERNMPPPPKFRNAKGTIRITEIFREPKTKQLSQSDRHIAVTGKIKIDLQCKTDCIQPVKQRRLFFRSPKYAAKFPKLVRKQNLFGQPDDKAPYPFRRHTK